ncbi:nmrA-like family domain-containing protein 1 isoform X1 [Polypterus senegalus]|uniref:nmrA-like family domain-containing protein 1 isoform X1 n=1 Tax=Polypterus senegalus TaxID=55291 RepID=UPI001966C17B|nr:nmrA-like family domain-containing protein 1 isoform X1 [Polypterus senegalus]
MSGRPAVVVFGATGAQGGSVAKALLSDGSFHVRAVTRNPRKRAARELARLGAEVVKADLERPESLRLALDGASAIFLVTDYWELGDKEREVTQGKAVGDLAKKVGVRHVVFSGLEDVNRLTGGRLQVSHFDGKGEVERHLRHISLPATCLRMPSYFENFIEHFRPQPEPRGGYRLGEYEIPMADIPMDGMSVEDLGPVVVTILKNRSEYIGKDIGLSAERLTIQQYAEVLSRQLKRSIRAAEISPEEYEKLPFPGAQDLANMFRFYRMRPERDLNLTRRLNPVVLGFEEWLSRNLHHFADL